MLTISSKANYHYAVKCVLLLLLLCRVLLPYEGCDVLHKFTPRPAVLAVHLLDVSQPKVGALLFFFL
jgi:hypothetical protein